MRPFDPVLLLDGQLMDSEPGSDSKYLARSALRLRSSSDSELSTTKTMVVDAGTGSMDSSRRSLEFIPVLGMPTSVLKYGHVTEDTEAMFIVVPGNPGVIEYYDHFMEHLHNKSNGTIPVWGVSHAGHVKPNGENKRLYRKYMCYIPRHSCGLVNLHGEHEQLYSRLSYEVCTLDGQIRHKVSFVQENVPKHVKLFFIGHSIGCFIILQSLSQLEHRVERCFQLFPTIERMAVSPNGKVYTPMLRYFRWLAPILISSISFILPENIKLWLINRHFDESTPKCIHSATRGLIFDTFAVSNSLFMANHEMTEVDQLDEELIRNNLHRLSFYFGQTDKWCPLQYYGDMKRKFPEGDFRLCENGYMHAYVIDASAEMAGILWDWVQAYL